MKNRMQEFLDSVKSIIYTVLDNEKLLQGEWHLGTVDSVISRYELSVFIDGSEKAQTIPCNPNVIFVENDEVWIHFVNGDSKNKFVAYKRATGTESINNVTVEDVETQWSDIKGKPLSSTSDIDSAVASKHEHDNLDLLQNITQSLKDSWDSAYTHISDADKHITTLERDKLKSIEEGAEVNTVSSVNGKLGEITITPEEMTKTYTHAQLTPSNEWVIAHTLGRFPSVVVTDSGGNEVHGDIQYIDGNTIKVRFTSEFSGDAHLN